MNIQDLTPLLRVIAGESVFDLDTDTKIRQAANEMTARALLELFDHCDRSADDWAQQFASMLMANSTGDPGSLIGFDDGRWSDNLPSSEELEEFPETASEHYLKLRFTNEDACYYQFHLFPSMNEPFIMDGARKRDGDTQYLRLGLTHEGKLESFIRNLRGNPHLVVVEESTRDEFANARSQAV